ncbi:aminoglycoside phosphotransferase family protein [Evansella halocellulosilytica]|uniref:aminoglycoside phosphotransferase family protein n=1 Tax=Evansella halocellulosilytica TaxID=2011013 RepID=UPI000BB8120A|nr:aminoglycoside phosphotransferase family protein [Evansella halocellulosilytica]
MDQIKRVLKDSYNIDALEVSPQQGGWSALAYKVRDLKKSYFLKVYEKHRSSTPKLTAMIDLYVPILIWLTENSGLKDHVPVPILTKDGKCKCEDEENIYLLHEFIEGETIGEKRLTNKQVEQLAVFISELHRYGGEIPVETGAIKEDYNAPFITSLHKTINYDQNEFPFDIWELVHPYVTNINHLIERVQLLSESLKSKELKLSLCHTDLHNWNMMQAGQQFILIDWEGLKLAPVEADLMFLHDKSYFNEFLNIYAKAHPNFTMNEEALQFYQWKRRLEDIWELIEQLVFDKQDKNEKALTMKYLKEELEVVSKED